ncbi:MAG TPA: hypothetical protein VK658_09480 [Chryseolinea sp.]|nr:hypothetical protein [Chryseolinea sp.]
MTDYIHLSGTTPYDEACAQIGSEDYMKYAKLEAHAYIRQLTRTFGTNPEGTRFVLAHNPHDFGTYIAIRFFYDDEDENHLLYMAPMEGGCAEWDATALSELKRNGCRLEREDDETEKEESGEPWEESYTYDNGPTGHGDDCLSDADSGL